jgi:hypothetical protein
MKTYRGNAVLGILVVVALVWGVVSLFSGNSEEEYEYTPSSDYPGYSSSYNDSDYSSYDESYSSGFSGTETMEACNSDTGNCYDLDIDSDGKNIERINFPNGGWRDVDYSDCDGGYCIVEDEDGTEWELQY